jgi:hypothetical protein
MTTVYVLWHVHRIDRWHEDEKLIGIYSTQRQARDAKARLRDKPGFAAHVRGFQIHPHTVDVDSWTEGFVTIQGGT